MNLERWLYNRDVAEYFLFYGINIAKNQKRRDEAEQEIERILRA